MTSLVVARETSVAVHGHEGSGWSEMDGAELYVQDVGSDRRERAELENTDALALQMREFAECVRTGADPEVTGEVGAEAVAVLEAARISVAERRPVALADVRSGKEAL